MIVADSPEKKAMELTTIDNKKSELNLTMKFLHEGKWRGKKKSNRMSDSSLISRNNSIWTFILATRQKKTQINWDMKSHGECVIGSREREKEKKKHQTHNHTLELFVLTLFNRYCSKWWKSRIGLTFFSFSRRFINNDRCIWFIINWLSAHSNKNLNVIYVNNSKWAPLSIQLMKAKHRYKRLRNNIFERTKS